MRSALSFTLTFALAACTNRRAPPVDAPSGTAPAYAGSSECRSIVDRFHARRLAGKGGCKTSADCACFNGVDPEVACGGITDRVTSDDLARIEQDFERAACTYASQCAPWACKPSCVEGHCK